MNRIFALRESRWPEKFVWSPCKMILAKMRQVFPKREACLIFLQEEQKAISCKRPGPLPGYEM